ncbi:peptidoglycan DD-metalloendopeptidase family protein [Kordiimonas aquimaris]|uniref:peptidoglycan DD-metalloendopeptidase family protein n=1 Tax=Kordiimonas aquimaris TaxID=707591 RepID=UPI0021CE1397|nr:peptidoglycan DD-metalloendopeptidase family protein [Kordiimonas aquimaris]
MKREKHSLCAYMMPLRSFGVLTLCMFLSACFGGSRPSPADIKPVYQVRNSPTPVPAPRWNPRRPPYAAANVQPRTQVAVKSTPTKRPTAQSSVPAPTTRQASSRSSLQTVAVRRGETLYALSRRHGVPVRSIIAENNLRAPYSLAIGQRLRIPVALKHTVVKGDTGYSISRRYGVNLAALMRANGIKKPYRLSVGQVLALPGGATPANVGPSSTQVATVSPPRGRTVPLPEPPARSQSGFIWPVDGKLASRFGPKEGGLHNDGINILARQGTVVRSAEAGVVVYASNALEGYGNLLLLKHADGWLTAYAHNERLLVNKGDQITKGQVIARVGSTGGVQEPQLHFEIRKGRRALDPLDYLNNKVASAR